MKGGNEVERRKKRYCVISVIDGREQFVDSFDLKDQAELCVLRIQQAYYKAPQYKFIKSPQLVIRDTYSDSACLSSNRTMLDRLNDMKRIRMENDRNTQEWVKRHEDSTRA